MHLGICFQISFLMFSNCYHILNNNMHSYHDLFYTHACLPLKSFISDSFSNHLHSLRHSVVHYANSKCSFRNSSHLLHWVFFFYRAFLFFTHYELGIMSLQITNNIIFIKTYLTLFLKSNLNLGPLDLSISELLRNLFNVNTT